MTTLRLVAGLAIALAAARPANTDAAVPADPEQVSGPPGGGMDQPTYAQYEADSQPSELSAPAQPYNDPGYGAPTTARSPPSPSRRRIRRTRATTMGPVTDDEIDSTLGTYGEWVEDPTTAACGVPTPRRSGQISHPTRPAEAGSGPIRAGRSTATSGAGAGCRSTTAAGRGWTTATGAGSRATRGRPGGSTGARRRLRRLASDGPEVPRPPHRHGPDSTITARRATRTGGS